MPSPKNKLLTNDINIASHSTTSMVWHNPWPVSSIMAHMYNHRFEQKWIIVPSKDLWSCLPKIRWWFLHVDCCHFKTDGFQFSQQIQVHKVLLAEQTCSFPAPINCRSLQHAIHINYHMIQCYYWYSMDISSFSMSTRVPFSYSDFSSTRANSPGYSCTFSDSLDTEARLSFTNKLTTLCTVLLITPKFAFIEPKGQVSTSFVFNNHILNKLHLLCLFNPRIWNYCNRSVHKLTQPLCWKSHLSLHKAERTKAPYGCIDSFFCRCVSNWLCRLRGLHGVLPQGWSTQAVHRYGYNGVFFLFFLLYIET